MRRSKADNYLKRGAMQDKSLSEHLEEIAKQIDLTESEVIRKRLKLMALYAKKDSQLILQKCGDQEQIII